MITEAGLVIFFFLFLLFFVLPFTSISIWLLFLFPESDFFVWASLIAFVVDLIIWWIVYNKQNNRVYTKEELIEEIKRRYELFPLKNRFTDEEIILMIINDILNEENIKAQERARMQKELMDRTTVLIAMDKI